MKYIIGAGGHAKSCAEVVSENSTDVFSVISFEDFELKCRRKEISEIDRSIIAIGDNTLRLNFHNMLKSYGLNFLTAISKQAYLPAPFKVGRGTVIMPRASLRIGTNVGAHSIINTAAIIEHDVKIGSFSHIGPGTVVCGSSNIGDNVLIGANCTILPGVKITAGVIVGAGSVVVGHLTEPGVYVGKSVKAGKGEK